jgi:uncharacterized membrane protein
MTNIPPPTIPPATPPPPGGGPYTPPPPPPPGGGYTPPGGGASSDRTLMIVLAYLWILALIPLLTKKDDAEVQWHAKNGIGILIAEIVAWLAFTVLGMVMPDVLGGCGIGMVSCVVWIAFLVIRILCIIKGVGGQRFTVPVLTDLGQKINF